MIAVSERLRIHSQRVGSLVWIPRTRAYLQVYPSKLICREGKKKWEFPWEGRGVCLSCLDLERGRVVITSGREKVLVYGSAAGLMLRGEVLQGVEMSEIESGSARYSLGCSKKGNWERMVRDSDMGELTPYWLRGATWAVGDRGEGGCWDLFERCLELYECRDRVGLEKAFVALFQASFKGICLPCRYDTEYLGMGCEGDELVVDGGLLKASGELLHNLLLLETEEGVEIFSFPLPSWRQGRCVDVPVEGGVVSYQWSEGRLRKVVARGKMSLLFPKEVHRYRKGKVWIQGRVCKVEGEVCCDRFER